MTSVKRIAEEEIKRSVKDSNFGLFSTTRTVMWLLSVAFLDQEFQWVLLETHN